VDFNFDDRGLKATSAEPGVNGSSKAHIGRAWGKRKHLRERRSVRVLSRCVSHSARDLWLRASFGAICT